MQQKMEIRDAVGAMLRQYHDEVRAKGLMAEFRFLDSSADFFWLPPGYTYRLGYDSVHDILQRSAPALKKVDNHFETLEIQPLSATQARYAGLVNSIVVDLSGRKTVTKLFETGFVVRRDDGWKLLFGRTTVADF